MHLLVLRFLLLAVLLNTTIALSLHEARHM